MEPWAEVQVKGETLRYAVTMVSEQVIVMIVERSCLLNHVRLFATPWTVACQAPLSMGFPRQKYWSGVPCCLLQGIFPTRVEPTSPVPPDWQADSSLLSYWGSPDDYGGCCFLSAAF